MANIVITEPCAKQQTLLASGARTSTSSGDTLPGIDAYTSADFLLDVTAASGTSPTLDVYIQKLLADGTTWQDIIHFAQASSTGKQLCSFVMTASATPVSVSTAAISANTQTATLLGNTIRVHYVIAGTSPSFTFSVTGDFYS